MDLPRIHYRLQHAKLHIDADLGKYDIQQPRPTFEMKRIDPKLDIRQPRGDLQVDASKAWDALAHGGNLEMMHRIYSSARNVAMDGIARIVENGNKLAAIHLGGEPIADNAQEGLAGFPEMDYAGPASYDNVDITYTARKAEIEVTPGRIEFNTKVNNPIVEYNRGKMEIYMKQYPNVEMIPPQIDMKV
ncbi:hypothetical protein FE783_23305 [Paenibacillus mesophilus]|uniref:DUF6470 family protein n=1 Tax=Paenibacillus mesophilus TaxID=2582849 RepID=UPI00110E5384|nr:DUF6470 family protein [Paenibacillus mesophilus]TMV47172.1 hypothetical protein FE783_23305 [Paenibacillus mesophilus]